MCNKESTMEEISRNYGDSTTGKKDDKSTWAVGGGVLMGIGVGFFRTAPSFSICWIYPGRIRHRSGNKSNNFKQKRAK
jgi:hypothetical protein